MEHKQQLILEAKRKKAMDLHLEYIVDQTSKYSDWLAQGLGTTAGSSEPSVLSSPPPDGMCMWVWVCARAHVCRDCHGFNDLFCSSPSMHLGDIPMLAVDSDYQLSSEEDVEDTIEEQERVEGEVDHEDEMNDLKEEGWLFTVYVKCWHLMSRVFFFAVYVGNKVRQLFK